MARRYADLSIFEGSKPLEMFTGGYAWKYEPIETFDPNISELGLEYYTRRGIILDSKKYSNIVYKTKANPAEKPKINLLTSMTCGLLFHERLLSKFKNLCSDQFQYFPILITNKDNFPFFENRDFYLINFLHLIDAIDVEQSIPRKDYIGLDPLQCFVRWEKLVFKENPWPEGSTIGRNLYSTTSVLFHPSLAKHFIRDAFMEFWPDERLAY